MAGSFQPVEERRHFDRPTIGPGHLVCLFLAIYPAAEQSRPPHLPAIPIPPRDLDYSQRPSSSCSSASSSSGTSTTPSLYASSGSSYTSSGSSFQEAQHQAHQLRRKGSRPLPKIPASSLAATPPAESSSPAQRSGLRPLPRPPRNERAASPSLLDVPRSTTPALRPLPTPIQPALLPVDPTSTITPSQAHCKPVKSLKPNRHPFPSLSIRIDAPGRSTTEIVLESPKGSISPLVFNRPLSLFQGTIEDCEDGEDEAARVSECAVIEKEEEVARRLSELGFVEMEEAEARYSSYSDSDDSSYGSYISVPESTVGTVTRPGTSMSLFSANRIPPPRWDSHRHKHSASSTSVRTVDEEPTTHYVEENVIRIELVPAAPPQSGKQKRASRASRMWVREKKGKRWVENDYLEVLSLLRKL